MKNKFTLLVFSISFLTISILPSLTFGKQKEYIIDKDHSEINFNIKHFTITKVSGKFLDYNASILWDTNSPENSQFSSTIKVNSINTNNKKRDSHLKESEFFDNSHFPYIKFKSKKITKKNNIYYVHGNLTIKNKTKPVSFPLITTGPIEDFEGKKRIGFESNFFINRKDFNIKWNKKLKNGSLLLSNIVNINLLIQALEK